jgi:hypothetical protein
MPALKPTLIGFQRAGDVAPVAEGDGLPIELSNIDTLLIGVVSIDSTDRDLMNNTDPETPTITQASAYRRFILYIFASSAATVTLTLRGRATDASGVPLNTGWVDLATVSIATAANTWYRVVLQASDGLPLGGDQYRVRVTQSTGSQTIYFNLKGER